MFKEEVTKFCPHPNDNTLGVCNACLGRAEGVIGVNISGTSSVRKLRDASELDVTWDAKKHPELSRLIREPKESNWESEKNKLKTSLYICLPEDVAKDVGERIEALLTKQEQSIREEAYESERARRKREKIATGITNYEVGYSDGYKGGYEAGIKSEYPLYGEMKAMVEKDIREKAIREYKQKVVKFINDVDGVDMEDWTRDKILKFIEK